MRLLLVLVLIIAGSFSAMAQTARFPSEIAVLQAAKDAGFTEEPKQIPATVVDVGTLRFVPYVSYRIGENRELNVYGDLESPACVEIGLYKELRDSAQEQAKCMTLMRKLFPQMDLISLRLSGGKSMKAGSVAEITPPDAPDSYDGWWISIYNLELLHKARGTSASISEVTVKAESSAAVTEWSKSEMAYARPSKSSPSGGRSVYVRGYTRKNGTYVRSHSRSK